MFEAMLRVDPSPVSRLSLLVDLASLLAREVDLDALLGAACERVRTALDADRATIWLVDAEQGDLVARVALLPELSELRQPQGRGLAGWVARTGEVVRVDDASRDPRFDPSADRATGYVTRSVLVAPIRESSDGPVRGVLQLLNRAHGPFDADDEQALSALGRELGRALELTTLRAERPRGPGLTLRGPFNRIVGTSPALEKVYRRVALASGTDATVLLRGETGTGKGLFARAIHVNSPRQSGPFVTVDCATLPGPLVESELFGHERGAFTGADRRVRGKVELAEGGTLFLDEIGELPLEMQGKLLRFLQERAFERVGGREALSADVRFLCATHRDLEALVSAGRFREDLYYRIKVVEIVVPTLRERGAHEIEALARHFAERHAARHQRPVPTLDRAAIAALVAHRWPGNVRELEHWVESAVVLAEGGRVTSDLFPQPAPRGDSVAPMGAARDVRGAAGDALGAAGDALGAARDALGAVGDGQEAAAGALGATRDALGAAPGAPGAASGALGATRDALGAARDALGAARGALGAARGALGAAEAPGGESTSVAIPAGLTLEAAMLAYARAAVRACAGNKSEAAKRLGVGRNTLGRMLKKS